MSYAIVFTDLTNTGIHSVIYDIPSNVLSLAAGVDKAYAPAVPAGAHQTPPGFNAGGFGYLGPCPPKPGGVAEEHVYEFELYAVNVAALPGATMTTTTTAARTLIQANSLGSTKLTAKYKQP